MKKAYPAVDLWRFLMALVVILIHSYVFDLPMSRTAQGWCDLLRNTAVASFFCCNGFFCFYGLELKRDEDWKKFWKRWRKFLRLYLIWYLIYLPFGVYGEVAVYQAGAAKGILKILYRFLVTGWGYYSWQMWYLHAAIAGLAALAWLRRKGVGCRVLLLACVLLYLAGEIMDFAYTNQIGSGFLALYYRLFYGTRNAVFYGGVFLSFGMFQGNERCDVLFPHAFCGFISARRAEKRRGAGSCRGSRKPGVQPSVFRFHGVFKGKKESMGMPDFLRGETFGNQKSEQAEEVPGGR